jgi:hypothetical protein
VQIRIRFSARALCGGNHGIDVERSAERYAVLLREAVSRDFPEAGLDIAAHEGASVEVVVDEAEDVAARTAERAVLDLAWVVKQCAPWSVPL